MAVQAQFRIKFGNVKEIAEIIASWTGIPVSRLTTKKVNVC